MEGERKEETADTADHHKDEGIAKVEHKQGADKEDEEVLGIVERRC